MLKSILFPNQSYRAVLDKMVDYFARAWLKEQCETILSMPELYAKLADVRKE